MTAGACFALVVTGCSGGKEAPRVAGDQAGSGGTKSGQQDPRAIRQAYVNCMHDQGQTGLSLDDKGRIVSKSNEAGNDVTGYNQAAKICDAKVPGMQQERAKGNAKIVEGARKFVACARKNGMPDMADPDPNDGTVVFKKAPDVEAFNRVNQLCNKEGQQIPGYKLDQAG
ncbi:hypothetical protein ACH475_35570 [Streptomyces globisporus]|uniref:hypothetical protein n=1 Tax=Streptomyces globisporus TaxID=1908 RepID=UPI0037B625B4